MRSRQALGVQTPQPTVAERTRLQSELLGWYRRERRELPWRATRDPYAILVSEAMLQQTRVEAVLGAYARFLQRFPDLETLARAREEEVLAAWSGLGYYRRARSLQATAQRLCREYGAQFPRTRAQLEDLPGIGRYTAGALLSIALGERAALVDGNVERVFSRYFGMVGSAGSAGLVRAVWELAEALLPAGKECGDWNQALMELGATLCTPRAPACERCPWRSHCRALELGRVEAYPAPKERPTWLAVEVLIACAERDGRWLLEQRPASGRMASLWQFPTIELPRPGSANLLFPLAFRGRGLVLAAGTAPLQLLRHTITRHKIRAQLVRARAPLRIGKPYLWCEPAQLADLGLTGMARKAWAWLAENAQASR